MNHGTANKSSFPCPPREHNAQAPQVPTVPGARKRVFHKGRAAARCGERSAPVCQPAGTDNAAAPVGVTHSPLEPEPDTPTAIAPLALFFHC